MTALKLLTSALLASAIAIPGAFAQGTVAGGAANLPSQRITNEKANGTGAAFTVSPATVRRVQQELNRLGYNSGSVDGNWDKATELALVHFQQARGLEPSGRLNEPTLNALGLNGGAGGTGNVSGGGGFGGIHSDGNGASGNLAGGNGARAVANGANGNNAAGMNGAYGNNAAGTNGAYGNNGAGANGAYENNAGGMNYGAVGTGRTSNQANRGYLSGVAGNGLSAGNLSGANGGTGAGNDSGVPPMRGAETSSANTAR